MCKPVQQHQRRQHQRRQRQDNLQRKVTCAGNSWAPAAVPHCGTPIARSTLAAMLTQGTAVRSSSCAPLRLRTRTAPRVSVSSGVRCAAAAPPLQLVPAYKGAAVNVKKVRRARGRKARAHQAALRAPGRTRVAPLRRRIVPGQPLTAAPLPAFPQGQYIKVINTHGAAAHVHPPRPHRPFRCWCPHSGDLTHRRTCAR
jgi:hypothetical protein